MKRFIDFYPRITSFRKLNKELGLPNRVVQFISWIWVSSQKGKLVAEIQLACCLPTPWNFTIRLQPHSKRKGIIFYFSQRFHVITKMCVCGLVSTLKELPQRTVKQDFASWVRQTFLWIHYVECRKSAVLNCLVNLE